MKKMLLIIAMLMLALFAFAACGEEEPVVEENNAAVEEEAAGGEEAAEEEPLEVMNIALAATPSSGQVFQFISKEQGFQEEEGVNVELVYINNVPDALQALAAEKVNVISTYGTGGPLLNISQGVDVDIIGGYMIIGETPMYGKVETEFVDLNSLVGKTIGTSRAGTFDTTIRGILYDAGILDQVTFVDYKKSQDVLQAIAAGEIDFGGTATGHQIQARNLGLEVKMWPDEYWPNHSCCRMLAEGTWIEDPENQEAVYRMLRAFLRAEEYHQTHKDETVQLVMKELDLDQETVESFVLSEHMKYDTDTFKNSVIKMWDKMQAFGYIEDTEVNIEDHINIEIYERALTSLMEDYPDSQFFQDKWAQFQENNY